MKAKYLLIAVAVFATGCSNQEPQPTGANNDLVQVGATDKLLTAADVDLTEPYYFAYQQEPVENYDTYNSKKTLTITVDEPTTLDIYGGDRPLETVDFSEPNQSVDLKAGASYQLDGQFDYYELISSEPTTAVISVA